MMLHPVLLHNSRPAIPMTEARIAHEASASQSVAWPEVGQFNRLLHRAGGGEG